MIHPTERELRVRRYEQIKQAMSDAASLPAAGDSDEPGASAPSAPERAEIVALIDHLARTRDVEVFRAELSEVADRRDFRRLVPDFGVSVATVLDRMIDVSEDRRALADVLVDSLVAPEDDEDARRRMHELVLAVEKLPSSTPVSTQKVAVIQSFFWSSAQPAVWPFLSSASVSALRRLGWWHTEAEPVDAYIGFCGTLRSFDDTPDAIDAVLAWFDQHPWNGLDGGLIRRLAWAEELDRSWDGTTYPPGDGEAARANMAAVLAELRILGEQLDADVGEAVERSLILNMPGLHGTAGVDRVRTVAWVKWRLRESAGWSEAPSIMLRANAAGVEVGLNPGSREPGWQALLRPHLGALLPSGLSFLPGRTITPTPGSYLVGRSFDVQEALGNAAIADAIIGVSAELQPLLDRVMAEAANPSSARSEASTEMLALRARFVAERGYPAERDQSMHQARLELAGRLRCDGLDLNGVDVVRQIANSPRYGRPGPQANLNRTLKDMDLDQQQRLVALLRVLLCGDAPIEDRIDRCLDPEDLGLKGLGEAVIMKLLAITDPDRFIPVFPVGGDHGKAVLLASLGETAPSGELSRGTRQVQANDRLRTLLEPLFPGDPWGMVQFAYWVRDRADEVADDPLDAVVEDCYLPDRSFVELLVELLEDKRQIVLYGPPGTGKTFLARKLAEALAPSESLRRFVQFHPSTSYEDFFEGYRPVADEAGNLSYELQPGPFASLADHAAEDARRHVLVIDELNRANVPKVFGELLFLLEYRDQQVSPLYRPEFSLPDNVWLIATMNTADRSIATLDAALRRRFHFVPIFPDDGPMSGLLDRYLERAGSDRNWARLVDMVNEELADRLGDRDRLIGPSHFMKPDLTEPLMERIWRYDIEPVVDDLFYGDLEACATFRWPVVLDRFRSGDRYVSSDEGSGGRDG